MSNKNIFIGIIALASTVAFGCKKIYQVEEVHTYETIEEKPGGGGNTGGNDNEIKVMSYDINYTNRAIKGTNTGVLDIEAVADVINGNKADVVCMRQVDQFTTRGQMDIDQAAVLANLTGMKYFYAPARTVSGGTTGNAVLSRYPILETENMKLFTAGTDEARCAAIAVLDLGSGKKVRVVSTQLEFAKEASRLTEIEELKAKIKTDDMPTILAGNMTANVGTASFIKLTEAFVLYTTETPLATFSYPNPTTVSDYIFYSSTAHFKVIDYHVAGYVPNRHAPLIVSFELK